MALPYPWFVKSRMTSAPTDSATSAVQSVEPSSTTMMLSAYFLARTTTLPIVTSSLNAGIAIMHLCLEFKSEDVSRASLSAFCALSITLWNGISLLTNLEHLNFVASISNGLLPIEGGSCFALPARPLFLKFGALDDILPVFYKPLVNVLQPFIESRSRSITKQSFCFIN